MKKIRFIYKTVAIVFLGILLSACFKPQEIKIDQETKDYCLFAEGSYWIYQDSATLAIDSVVIDSIIYERVPSYRGDDNIEDHTECFSINISSHFQDSTHKVIVGLSSSTYECYGSDLSSLNFGWIKMYHNGKRINGKCDYYRESILIDKKNNSSVNGVSFNDVKVFKYKKYEQEKIFYWAKHIGLIREEIHENDRVVVKNLIRYNVKPYNK